MAAAPEGIVREDGKIRYAGETYISGVIRTMHCEVTELAYNLHYSQHSVRDAPEFRPYFRGQAVIAHDCICVVGTDHARASVLNVSIQRASAPEAPPVVTPEQEAERQERHETRRRAFLDPFDERDAIFGRDITVALSFAPAHWEFQQADSLWLEIHLPASIFDALQAECDANRLAGVSLGLRTSLWVPEFERYSPPSASVCWFLFPERSHTDSATYEMAQGWVSSLTLRRPAALTRTPARSEAIEGAG